MNIQDYSVDQPEAHIECDVVIVGSGAGGGIAAEILSRSGLKVILLEEGPYKTSADFKMLEKNAYPDLYQEVAGRQTTDKAIQILQGKCVGGSTTVNWASCFRTPKATLDYWRREFSVKGMSVEQLAPWFDWVEKRLHIAPWIVPPNANNQLLAEGARKLGWNYQVISRNVNGCANLGYCGMGCPINAKQSMLVSTIPEALKHDAQLISRARVEKLLLENSIVQGVSVTSMTDTGAIKSRNVSKVFARYTILSAGAIGSPAILMRSQLHKKHPLIGKRTFLHPVTASIAKMSQPVNAFEGAPQSIYSDEFLWRDGVAGELGYKIEVPPLHPLLASTLLRQHGQQHASLMQNFGYYQANLALLRDGFHEDSIGGEVSLDAFDDPLLSYPVSDILWRGLRHAMLSMAEIQFAAGAKKVMALHMNAGNASSWPEIKKQIDKLPTEIIRWQIMSAHVMGGCPMGDSDELAVCDSNGHLFGVEQLAVLDGSLFPTSLGANPQLSIYAIVAKLASQLAVQLNATLPADLATVASSNLKESYA